jgi:hypothetical protein
MERHWCGVCNQGAPVEMRHVRDKRLLISNTIAPLVSPLPAPLELPRFFRDKRIGVAVRPSHIAVPFPFTQSAIIGKRT